jgi:hypothetical protein
MEVKGSQIFRIRVIIRPSHPKALFSTFEMTLLPTYFRRDTTERCQTGIFEPDNWSGRSTSGRTRDRIRASSRAALTSGWADGPRSWTGPAKTMSTFGK